MTKKVRYDIPTDDEGFLYVREWEDQKLVDNFLFLSDLYQVVASEIAFRADNPEHRDETADIGAKDVKLYELADKLPRYVYHIDRKHAQGDKNYFG